MEVGSLHCAERKDLWPIQLGTKVQRRSEMFDILRFLMQNRDVIPEGDHVDVIRIRNAFESEKS